MFSLGLGVVIRGELAGPPAPERSRWQSWLASACSCCSPAAAKPSAARGGRPGRAFRPDRPAGDRGVGTGADHRVDRGLAGRDRPRAQRQPLLLARRHRRPVLRAGCRVLPLERLKTVSASARAASRAPETGPAPLLGTTDGRGGGRRQFQHRGLLPLPSLRASSAASRVNLPAHADSCQTAPAPAPTHDLVWWITAE